MKYVAGKGVCASRISFSSPEKSLPVVIMALRLSSLNIILESIVGLLFTIFD